MVQVGAQVAVTAQPGTGIILQQQQHKHTQGVPLERGACIGRATTLVKTAFVTDPDALVVPTAGMGTRQGQGTQGLDVTVLADIKMIPRSVESAPAVADIQIIFREALVLARGGAMDYY